MVINYDNRRDSGYRAHRSECNSGTDTTVKQQRRVPGEALLLTHTRGLLAYAMALTRNSFEAEELVQETYVRAIGAMGRLREESNLRAWLFTILRNVRLNQLRQQRARPRLLELDADENTAALMMENAKDPYSLLVRTVETNRVWEAIQKLPDDFRAIILMREYRELSYQEIATLLDCPLGTVMSRLARARSKLGALLTGIRYPSNQKNNRTNRKDRNRARLSSGGRREY